MLGKIRVAGSATGDDGWERLIARAAVSMRLAMQRTIARLCGTRGAFESNGRRYFAPHHMLGDADTAHIKRTSSYDSNPMAKSTDSISRRTIVPFLAAHN
jgi:hypothetical protein